MAHPKFSTGSLRRSTKEETYTDEEESSINKEEDKFDEDIEEEHTEDIRVVLVKGKYGSEGLDDETGKELDDLWNNMEQR